MTPATWRDTPFPLPLLNYLSLNRQISDRKARLFAIACARMVWPQITESDSQRAVEAAERFVERRDSFIGIEIACRFANDICDTFPSYLSARLAVLTAEPTVNINAVAFTVFEMMVPYGREQTDAAVAAANLRLARLVRDIFPFSLAPFDSDWRTSAVSEMAARMYADRNFTAMPVLADALEEAGCRDEDLLEHCRNPEVLHVRGCWVIDLVLNHSQ